MARTIVQIFAIILLLPETLYLIYLGLTSEPYGPFLVMFGSALVWNITHRIILPKEIETSEDDIRKRSKM